MRRVGREMGYVGAVGGSSLKREKIDYLLIGVKDGATDIWGWMRMAFPPSLQKGKDRKKMV